MDVVADPSVQITRYSLGQHAGRGPFGSQFGLTPESGAEDAVVQKYDLQFVLGQAIPETSRSDGLQIVRAIPRQHHPHSAMFRKCKPISMRCNESPQLGWMIGTHCEAMNCIALTRVATT